MLIRELTYLPTGDVLVDKHFDTSELDPGDLAGYERWWRTCESPALASSETALGPLQVKFTFAGAGHALGTWTLANNPVFSSVLLAGIEPEGDAELNEMFLASMRNLEPVKQFAKQPLPFEGLRTVRHRPLVGGIFWPTIPQDHFSHIVPAARLLNASFFRARPETGA